MITTVALFLICIVFYAIKRGKDWNYWERRGVPFVKPWPIIGNMAEILFLGKSITVTMKELYFKFDERFFGIWYFNKPELIIKCPDLIRHIFVKDSKYFLDRNITFEDDLDDLTGNMIFFMKYPKWKHFRSKTTKVFSAKSMKKMFPQMQAVTKNLIDFINRDSDSRSVELVDVISKYTTQTAFLAAFGTDSKSFQNVDTLFVTMAKRDNVTVVNLLLLILHHCRSSLAYIMKLNFIKSSVVENFKEFLIEVLERRKSLKCNRGDFVDFLIEFGQESSLRDNEIAAQAIQFLVAGYDSTNTVISLAVYELALNKCLQKKLREEIMANLDNDGDINYESLSSMDYLDKVVYETLRKYPTFPMIGRTCTTDYKIPDSAVVIEKGVAVIVSLIGLHHDPKHFPNPKVFDPERFSLENVRRRHPCAFLPFGDGQRSCIGRRMGLLLAKLGIAYVIKNYEVDICKDTTKPLEFNPKRFNLSVSNGIYVQFTRRTD